MSGRGGREDNKNGPTCATATATWDPDPDRYVANVTREQEALVLEDRRKLTEFEVELDQADRDLRALLLDWERGRVVVINNATGKEGGIEDLRHSIAEMARLRGELWKKLAALDRYLATRDVSARLDAMDGYLAIGRWANRRPDGIGE
jgi:hypothetical protein